MDAYFEALDARASWLSCSTPWSAVAWHRFGPTCDAYVFIRLVLPTNAATGRRWPKRRRAGALQGVDPN